MRITNNMMLRSTSSNINGNKINVNNMNNQMSSQKKIQRPSEDPVIAIRSLRLRSTLSEIDQYYKNNIPDAESWMEVTETALKNMKSILTDVRTQCINGANDSLKPEDRNTILTQLTKLRDQIYAEGNADYANRTVFTGYRTNQKLTFMEDDLKASYEITQDFTYSDIQEYRYYSGEITVPTTPEEVTGKPVPNPIPNPDEAVLDRVRLAYGGVDSITDANGNVLGANGDTGTINYKGTTDGTINVTVYDTYEDWAAANGGKHTVDEAGGASAVLIKSTGELVLGDTASADLRANKASLSIDYKKTGFDKGEVRPEYYFNCTDVTLPGKPIEYTKYDANGNEIYQDINYVVSSNQTLTVNTNASDVFDASIGRDVDEMIDAVKRAIDANKKVADIEAMQKMEEYSSDECQAALENWLAAAKKEADYADDNMQKLYNSYIGNCDEYIKQVNQALTDVGSKGASLELTKNRMSNQQTTISTLKSTNEDRDLSDIIIDYTASYVAYQASLQAASKINQNTLLNYL